MYILQGIKPKSPEVRSVATKAVSEIIPISRQLGANYHLIRIAALSGAAAVCLAAYGRHSLKDDTKTKEFRNIYESANQMHLVHSVALLAAPLTKRPMIVSSNFFINVKTSN